MFIKLNIYKKHLERAMLKKLVILFSVVVFIFSYNLQAQSLEQTLSNLSSTAGTSYVKPVISAFGSNLNSGWVSKLPSSTKVGFHFDLKIIAAGSLFDEDDKKFLTQGKFFFDGSQVDQILAASGYNSSSQGYTQLKNEMLKTEFDVSMNGPTIVGSKNEKLKIVFPKKTISASGQSYTVNEYTLAIDEVKGLLDELPILPTPGIQATVGTVLGTNLSVRYSPKIKTTDDLGDFSLIGFGLINNPSAFFPVPLPVDLGVGYFTQTLKVGDVFESTASQFGLYVGKTFGLGVSISPFAGMIFEKSNTKVQYDYQSNQTVNGVPVPKAKVKFELDGENKTGFVVGFNLKLAVVNIFADYKAAATKTVSAGISFGF